MSVIERERVEAPSVPDVLERAALLLEEFGWCQKRAGSKEAGKFCMWGAMLAAACERFPNGDRRADLLLCSASYEMDGILPKFIDWNDTPGRTKQEVIQALRDAAEQARA